MALIKEDGSHVSGANSYSELAEIRAYAEARGRTLPIDDETVEAYAIRAMDYLESFRDRYKGSKAIDGQGLQWPRTDVVIDNVAFAEDAIPIELQNAHSQLTIDVASGVELFPVRTSLQNVRRKKVGPLETEWFEGGGVSPILTALSAYLKPLLRTTAALTTVRV